jgi:hypothetical protein
MTYAGTQTIAKQIADQAGFAVNNLKRSFVAVGNTISTTIA